MTDTAPVQHPYRTGRKPARHVPELAIHNFRSLAERTALPSSGDVTNGITQWGMLGNDVYGDCVPAATEHYRMSKGLFTGDAAPTTGETEDLYFDYGVAQGEQGPTPDEGVEIASWLKWLFDETQAAKIAGDDIEEIAYAEIDDLTMASLNSEMLAFRGIILGVNLTDDAQQLFPNSPWTIANGEQPDPNEGHGILHVKYDDAAKLAGEVSWALIEGATYDWIEACCEEAWVIMTREDAENAGVDFDACVAAIKAHGGTVAPDLPTPVTPPTPAPVPEPVPAPPAPAPVPAPPAPSPGPTPPPKPPTPEPPVTPPAPPGPTPGPNQPPMPPGTMRHATRVLRADLVHSVRQLGIVQPLLAGSPQWRNLASELATFTAETQSIVTSLTSDIGVEKVDDIELEQEVLDALTALSQAAAEFPAPYGPAIEAGLAFVTELLKRATD
jgi:hypothetical protein